MGPSKKWITNQPIEGSLLFARAESSMMDEFTLTTQSSGQPVSPCAFLMWRSLVLTKLCILGDEIFILADTWRVAWGLYGSKVETPIHDNIRELVNWECKEHGVKSWMC